MADPTTFEDDVMSAIILSMQKKANELVDQYVEEMRAALNNQADSVALSVLSEYEMRTMNNRIIIEVKKKGV